jgi:hypothetical protein
MIKKKYKTYFEKQKITKKIENETPEKKTIRKIILKITQRTVHKTIQIILSKKIMNEVKDLHLKSLKEK